MAVREGKGSQQHIPQEKGRGEPRESSPSLTGESGTRKLGHGSGVREALLQGWVCLSSLRDFAAVAVQKRMCFNFLSCF